MLLMLCVMKVTCFAPITLYVLLRSGSACHIPHTFCHRLDTVKCYIWIFAFLVLLRLWLLFLLFQWFLHQDGFCHWFLWSYQFKVFSLRLLNITFRPQCTSSLLVYVNSCPLVSELVSLSDVSSCIKVELGSVSSSGIETGWLKKRFHHVFLILRKVLFLTKNITHRWH